MLNPIHARMPLILYAPNVHTGGGLVLLKALLATLPHGPQIHLMLDARARHQLQIPSHATVDWFYPKPRSRWQAETILRSRSSKGTLVLCFHGLPPLLPNAGQVMVFQQNRNYFGHPPLSAFKLRTALRVALERFISRRLRRRVDCYLVQTPSMKRALLEWYAGGMSEAPRVEILPFLEGMPDLPAEQPKWDFVYVADGEAHKNHPRLLEAWLLLAQQGLKPSLALTLSGRDAQLSLHVAALRDQHGLNIEDLGQMSHEEVFGLYRKSRAMIFPSLSESFGLPLIEATRYGLPIVASELDFVRDVCVPAQTFDPTSAVSIARAVQRFMGIPEQPRPMLSAHDFWEKLVNPSNEPASANVN